MKTEALILALLFLIIVLGFTLIYSLSSEISGMKAQIGRINESLGSVKAFIEKVNKTSSSSDEYTCVAVSEVVSNPSRYENRRIVVVGEFHHIATIPEIRLPYNAVVASNNSQIGVSTTLNVREGARVRVEGVLVKGYQERLGENGWVREREVYYIVAIRIEQI